MGAVSYREVAVKSALTRVQGMPFAWSLNPYTGCSHACTYCFARQYHALRGRDTGAGFDREIEVKKNFVEVLRLELRRLRLRELVALGTGTDPYQPCEGRYRLTRGTLEALIESPLPLIVITKGTLVVRDIDLLVKLSRVVDVRICVSIGTKSTFKLLEALAGAIGAKIQELYPQATVAIELEKLAPPCPGVPAACGVRIVLPSTASKSEPAT